MLNYKKSIGIQPSFKYKDYMQIEVGDRRPSFPSITAVSCDFPWTKNILKIINKNIFHTKSRNLNNSHDVNKISPHFTKNRMELNKIRSTARYLLFRCQINMIIDLLLELTDLKHFFRKLWYYREWSYAREYQQFKIVSQFIRWSNLLTIMIVLYIHLSNRVNRESVIEF